MFSVFDGMSSLYSAKILNLGGKYFNGDVTVLDDEERDAKIGMEIEYTGPFQLRDVIKEYELRGPRGARPDDQIQFLNIVLGKYTCHM
jgi:hypothetical protein